MFSGAWMIEKVGNAALAQRLKAELRGRATVEEAAETAGVSAKTMFRWFKGDGSPKPAQLDKLIGRYGLNAMFIYGVGSESGDWESDLPSVESDSAMVSIPLKEWVTVSAGNGAVATQESRAERFIGFRGDWVRRNFGTVQGLSAFPVQGDSMLPELGDGDLVMIDEAQKEGPDGLYVVRVGDLVLVKRVQRIGRSRFRLLSSNSAYAPVEVDLANEADGFDIIGRVVWAAKKVG